MELNVIQKTVSELLNTHKIVVCTAPRGSGKTLLSNHIKKTYEKLGLKVMKYGFDGVKWIHPSQNDIDIDYQVKIYDDIDFIKNAESQLELDLSFFNIKKILLIGTQRDGLIAKYAKRYPSVHFNGYVCFSENDINEIKSILSIKEFEAQYSL